MPWYLRFSLIIPGHNWFLIFWKGIFTSKLIKTKTNILGFNFLTHTQKKIKQPIYALEAPDSQQFQFLLLHSHPRKQARTILLINKKSHQLRKTCTYCVSICSVMPTLQVLFYLHDISVATAVINIFSCLGIFGKTLLLEDIVLWEFGHK